MMVRFSTARMARWNSAACTAASLAAALLFLADCAKKTTPQKVVRGDPLSDLPVVLSRQALVVQDQTRDIGKLFNEFSFQERKREAERVKAEHEAQIGKLREEIEERFAYVKAVESLKNNIEEDGSKLAPYFELVSQAPGTSASDEELWKLAAVWVVLERKATQYRQFVDDVCAGQMAQKYLSLSDDIQKTAEKKIHSVLSGTHSRFSDIYENYGKESSVSRLEEHLETLDRFACTLTWIGSDYYDMQHTLYSKGMTQRSTGRGPASESKALYSTSFDEVMLDIQASADNVRSHIAVCKVYESCAEKFGQFMENGLQANEIPLIDGLKDQLADTKLRAPNEDSEKLLTRGREEMDRRVEQEADRMRRTLEQYDDLCSGRPDFADPEGHLGRLRKAQEELRATKSVFYALNLFDEAEKADHVKERATRLEKAFGKLCEMNDAYQEMEQYARQLREMPGYGLRTSAQQQTADQIRDKLRDYRARFSKWVSDVELREDAERCLAMTDSLIDQIGG